MRQSSNYRWIILLAATALQLCLGTVYAWSYFQDPLVAGYGWTNTQVTWTFSLAICCLGLAAAWGGSQLPRFGPRRLAMGGGILFGAGYLLAALALHWKSLPLLYAGYGVIGGIGLGLGYVTPVATVARWFPDKKGLATGTVIMGFGFGALVMSKVFAPRLYELSGGNMVAIFAWLGAGFMVATVLVASLLRYPPADAAGESAARPNSAPSARAADAGESRPSILPDLCSARFATMWIVFFCNILAGISIIGFQSPLFKSLWHARDTGHSPEQLAAYGATLIGASSIFNGIGRMFWGGLSDRVGRAAAFRFMLASQIVVFALLPLVGDPWLFGAAICYVLLCYGGGFGTMPSFVSDVFGVRKMPVVYGAILTAWSAAGIAGPQLIALLKDRYGDRAGPYAFLLNAAVLSIGLAFAWFLKVRAPADRAIPTGSPAQAPLPERLPVR
jgi:MFS transporter, OFA family, oxalate/formate antiporter